MRASSFETARSLSSGAHSRDPLAPPQDEVLNPHGEERGYAARLEPRGRGGDLDSTPPTVFWKAPSRLQRRGHLARDLNQRGNQRRHRIALRNTHPNAVVYDGIDNRNAADGIGKPERLRELCRHHARPAAGPDV